MTGLRIHLASLVTMLLACAASAGPFVMPADMPEVSRKRFAKLESFQIRGVCNDSDLERLSRIGVNTVRGYTIAEPATMLKKLDDAHRLGMKMILSEWMPHHGANKTRDGAPWGFDYNAKEEAMLKAFIAKVEGIGDHPAILMWGLGNEVHLDEPYLRVANRMSLAIHERFPHHLTSLTIVNAKPESIATVKKYAPDIDVLGVQSYSRGAVRNAIKNAENYWAKPFYMSEFNTNGPWNFRNSEWGVALDEPVTKKVSDLKDCYLAIDQSSLCLGSTIFAWGHYVVFRPTYFSTLLHPNPAGPKPGSSFADLLVTPQAEVMIENFTGKPPEGNRAPVLSKLQFEGGANARFATPGESMRVEFASTDANDDAVEYVSWILDSSSRRTKVVSGPYPQASTEHANISAPSTPGEYLLMTYVVDNKGGGSASTIAFKVLTAAEAATRPSSTTTTPTTDPTTNPTTRPTR
jgi:hypothetical protein